MSQKSEVFFQISLPKTFDCPFCLSFSEFHFFFVEHFPPPLSPVCSRHPVWQVLGNTGIHQLQQLGPKHVRDGGLKLFLCRFAVFLFVNLLSTQIPRACCASNVSVRLLQVLPPQGCGGSAGGFQFRRSGLVQHMAIVMEGKRK